MSDFKQLEEMLSLTTEMGPMPEGFSLVQVVMDLNMEYGVLPEIMSAPSIKEQLIQAYDVKSHEFLAEGAYGRTYRIFNLQGQSSVLKVQMPKHGLASKLWQYWDLCRKEINLLRMVNHENVMRLYGHRTFTSPAFYGVPIYTVMHCEDLDIPLSMLLKKVGRIRNGQQYERLFNDLSSGLGHLHSLGIVHHDLKPENVMVANRKGSPRLFDLSDEELRRSIQDFFFKIIDLGLAKHYPDSSIKGMLKIVEKGCPGTRQWLCPQKLSSLPYNPFLSDVHALGLILLACLLGEHVQCFTMEGKVSEENVRSMHGEKLSLLDSHHQRLLFRMLASKEQGRPLLVDVLGKNAPAA